MSIDQTGVKDIDPREWIKFRAEQLASRAEPVKFAGLYIARAQALGTKNFRKVHLEFCNFLQPFIDDARRAQRAESEADYWFSGKGGKWDVPATNPWVHANKH
jgi:hypothetical protein